jgi:hypothetical protein
LTIAPTGWTMDHMRDAAKAFTSNPNKGGAAALADIVAKYCPPGTAKPSIKLAYPAWWPQLYNDLTAA